MSDYTTTIIYIGRERQHHVKSITVDDITRAGIYRLIFERADVTVSTSIVVYTSRKKGGYDEIVVPSVGPERRFSFSPYCITYHTDEPGPYDLFEVQLSLLGGTVDMFFEFRIPEKRGNDYNDRRCVHKFPYSIQTDQPCQLKPAKQ